MFQDPRFSMLIWFFGTIIIGYFVLGQSGKFIAMLSGLMAILMGSVGVLIYLTTKNDQFLTVAMYSGIVYFILEFACSLAVKKNHQGFIDRFYKKCLNSPEV